MGMNMVTIATKTALETLVKETSAHVVTLSGNLCVDKKPSALNLIEGRGKSMIAEITIPREVVEKKLKTTPEAIVEVNITKNLIGTAIAGSMGFNAHYANMIGAIFLATGQDGAHIVEGSLGITVAEVVNGEYLLLCHTSRCANRNLWRRNQTRNSQRMSGYNGSLWGRQSWEVCRDHIQELF